MKALRFEGNGFEYFKIWIVNILLIIITLGVYYPWAKVRNLRYFYANSTLDGRNFEYHATGKQLFIGYMIATALLITVSIVQNISPISSAAIIFLSLFAAPWIIWRSYMFSMRMTSFSNVRFSFDGKLSGAYINFMLLPIALFTAFYIVPVGMAILLPMAAETTTQATTPTITPTIVILAISAALVSMALSFYLFALMKKKNTCYAINSYRYGQGVFITNLKTKKFVAIGLKTIGLCLLTLIIILLTISVIAGITATASGLSENLDQFSDPEVLQHLFNDTATIIVVASIYILMIFVSFFLMAYYQTRQRTYVLSNTTLDKQISFSSTLRARSLAFVAITNFLLVAFTLGLGLPWAKVRMAKLMLANTCVNTDVGFDEYITQQQDEQSALGEQMGDAFDVDINIGV